MRVVFVVVVAAVVGGFVVVVVVDVVVVVVSDATMREQCLCQQQPMNCSKGALDDEELFIIEGSKNWPSTPGQPGGARKMRKNRKKPLHRRHPR